MRRPTVHDVRMLRFDVAIDRRQQYADLYFRLADSAGEMARTALELGWRTEPLQVVARQHEAKGLAWLKWLLGMPGRRP
jgi:hypothetical protein